MPELPEVEVVKQGLSPLLSGRTIVDLVSDGKSLRTPVPVSMMQKLLPGKAILSVKRRAKYLLLELEDKTLLIIHLGMTGKLGLFPKGAPEIPHDHICWYLDNDMELRFNDIRRFGSVVLLPAEKSSLLENTFFHATGPEPFDEAFNADYLLQKAAGRKKPIKNFIMDSSVVAGIGNIYANESLFKAKIRPSKPSGSISKKKWHILIGEIRNVLNEAIACGGSTISDFIGASGDRGYFQINFNVYGRKDQSCPRCSIPIKLLKLGGRSSFFCPKCQK